MPSERADKRDTHADGDKDETFGLGQLERALDGSADAEHGHSRVIALSIETQAQVTPLGLFDELAAGWPRCRCQDCGWWRAYSVETRFRVAKEGVGTVQRRLKTVD
jgi:hypothetical protein